MKLFVTYLILAAAIVCEVTATTALARSASFTRLVPSLITVVGYCSSIGLMSIPMRVMPTGIVYAIWSGVGIVLITAVAWLRFGQKLDGAAIAGMGLIIAGVVVINAFSKSIQH